MWIDSSYEGDLAFVGGAEMVWWRDFQAQYGEHGASRREAFHFNEGVDPFWSDGTVIPGAALMMGLNLSHVWFLKYGLSCSHGKHRRGACKLGGACAWW